MKIEEIARLLGAEVVGDAAAEIRRVAKIEEAGEGDITFLANLKYSRFLSQTRASAVIVGRNVQLEEAATGGNRPVLVRVDDPYFSFLKVLVVFHPPADPLPPGIHSSAIVLDGAVLAPDVRVGAGVVIGRGVRVEKGSILGHGTVLCDGVVVGENTLLHAGVIVREGCRIGSRVIIQSGAVIGSDGFGFAPKPDGTYEKIPQMGTVVIEDDVEIGANTTVDRATLGETRIKRGTKLDNLIQIAHNVVIGENTVMAAQAGVSGSTKIGKNCMVGGQVGFAGHIEVADGAKIGARAGVHHSITKPGGYFGTPAMPQREGMRVMASLGHIPDALAELRELKAKVARLEELLHSAEARSTT
jgi:UDP-3-O-[3-hydroxymyristoyl] glucosamine N-acyltransferase